MNWRTKRQLLIALILLTPFVLVSAFLFYRYTSSESCFDGDQNQNEEGIDCGGVCEKVCAFQAADPSVLWSRAFEVTGGVYNALAMIENPNVGIDAESVPYTFTLYDSDNLPILERKGTFYLPPERRIAVFEQSIISRERTPHRVTFELTADPEWRRIATTPDIDLSVTRQRLSELESTPRLDATLINPTLYTLRNVYAVAVLYDERGNAVHTSRTVVEELQSESSANIVFTWPEPFDIEPGICEQPADVMLALDRSGSMNNEGENPPQPLSYAKDAALSFVNELSVRDRAGLVTFGTEASSPIDHTLTGEKASLRDAVSNIAVRPQDEAGMTNIADALKGAHAELLKKARTNGDYKKVIVLLTDGRANAPEPDGEAAAREASRASKEEGIEFYTIGLGENINHEFLEAIAGDPTRFFEAREGFELREIYQEISTEICDKGPYVIEIIPHVNLRSALDNAF